MAIPTEYCILNDIQKFNISSIIEEFDENLINISGKCMDVGCGPGDTTKDILLPILGLNAQIIGTDISESMVKYANETFSDNRVQFEVLDIQTKNLPKKYISEFDHIFSFHTLHWCNDIRQAFTNMYQMLRPNGTILLYTIASHYVFEVLRILIQDIRFSHYMPDKMKNISPFQDSKNARKELKEVLQDNGFKVHHCSFRESSYSVNNPGQFFKSLASIFKFHEDMPQDLIKEFKDTFIYECTRRIIKYKSHNNENLTLHLFKGLIVYAQKIE